ncbi:MAG: MAPEG family protein [Pseudomonadota bacterium]
MTEIGMTAELWAIAGLSAVGLALIVAQQLYNDLAKGLGWAMSNREDQDMPAASLRFDRAVRNHLESSALFVPVALAVALAGVGTQTTAIAAVAFLAFRAGHSLSYAIGVTHVRSAMWIGGVVATIVTGWPLIGALLG